MTRLDEMYVHAIGRRVELEDHATDRLLTPLEAEVLEWVLLFIMAMEGGDDVPASDADDWDSYDFGMDGEF